MSLSYLLSFVIPIPQTKQGEGSRLETEIISQRSRRCPVQWAIKLMTHHIPSQCSQPCTQSFAGVWRGRQPNNTSLKTLFWGNSRWGEIILVSYSFSVGISETASCKWWIKTSCNEYLQEPTLLQRWYVCGTQDKLLRVQRDMVYESWPTVLIHFLVVRSEDLREWKVPCWFSLLIGVSVKEVEVVGNLIQHCHLLGLSSCITVLIRCMMEPEENNDGNVVHFCDQRIQVSLLLGQISPILFKKGTGGIQQVWGTQSKAGFDIFGVIWEHQAWLHVKKINQKENFLPLTGLL